MAEKKSHLPEHYAAPHAKTLEKPAEPKGKPLIEVLAVKPQTLAVEPQEAVPSVPEACEAFITFVETALHDSAYQEAVNVEIAKLRKSLVA